MSKFSRVVWPALMLAVAAGPAAAQVRDTARVDTTVYRIGGITVTAARPVTTAGGSSAIDLNVDSMELAAVPTLEEVLREAPVIHVRTNSRGEAEITMRGSESRQVAVLMDGVPLTLGWDSRTDVSVIPALAPRNITIVRGLSSMLFGPNTLGGIIELDVAAGDLPMPPRSAQWTVGIDHVGGYGASGTAAFPFESNAGRWLVRAGGGYRSSPGATLADGVVEPVPADDDDLRLNTDADEVNGFFAARYAAESGAWASFTASGYRAERGVAAELGVSEPRLWRYPLTARAIGAISAGTRHYETPFGRGDLEASVGVDIGRTEIDAFESRLYENVVEEENGDDRTYTVRLLGDHTLGARGDLHGAFTYADIHHDENLTGEPESNYRQRLWSFGLESSWRLIEDGSGTLDNVRLSVGGAFDMADTPETGGKPALDRLEDWGARAGITAALLDGDAILHAGVSRRARFPALRELYSGALGRFEPNPSLTPERLVATEGGITTRLGNGEIQAVVFHHRLNDAVVQISLPDGKRQRVNRDEVRSTGLELLASTLVGPVALAGDLTLQNVDLRDPTAGEREPENMPSVFGSANAHMTLPLDLRAGAEARYTGSQFCLNDSGDDVELDAATLVGGSLSRRWGLGSAAGLMSHIETSVTVDNVFEAAQYDSCGLPEPGRLLRFQIRLF